MDTKSSAALRYLESHEVFTLEEYLSTVDETVTERTRYSNLQNALRRGQAYRIRRGLYASNLGVYRDRVPNVFLVAAKTAADAVITHHSALEASRGRPHTLPHRVLHCAIRRWRTSRCAGIASTESHLPDSRRDSSPVNG